MNLFVLDALKFVSSTFMLEATLEKDISEELPFQLRNKATLCFVKIEERDFVMIASEDRDVLLSNNALHIKRIEGRYNLPLIIVVATDAGQELRRLVKQLHGGLVVPWKFATLPSLLIHSAVAEIAPPINRVDTEKPYGIIPSFLICYYFAGYFDNGFSSIDVMDILGISKMAVSRAVKEMTNSKLIKPIESGRSKQFHFTDSRKGLWNNQRHRISPLSTGSIAVKKSRLPVADLFTCGESALSRYTLLGSPAKPSLGLCMTNDDRYMRPITPATIEGDYFFKIMKIISDDYYEGQASETDATLQIFPYNPLITNGFLDMVFLAFTRINKNDIRVKSSFFELETTIYNNLKN
ncbi:hypothetical protein ACIPMZ_20955 [Scandinavium goeteborgense]|uniref:hypothetical protein n=1 Tax=Scandinavium goeteborgense TaxID=1851514 RepID=UPI003815EC26